MNKEKKLPGLRFPGFDGEWEEKKIIDVAPLQRGFDLPKSEMLKGDYPVVMSNGINGYHYKFKAKAPGVVTGRSGTLGNLNYIESNYWPHNTTLWVTDFKGNNPRYIYYMYQKLDLVRFGTGSGVPTLNRNDVHDTRIFIPNHEEQCNISLFLCSLDKLIALHQQKLTHLQERKKGLLQKMFPKAGEKVPELRFPGLSGDWEEKKLGGVVDISSGYTGDANLNDGMYKLTRIETIADGVVNINRVGFSNEEPEIKYVLNYGDILFSNINSLAHIGKVAIFLDKIKLYHGINLLRLIPKDEIYPQFLYFQLCTEIKRNWSKIHANKAVSQASINQTELSKQLFFIPSKKEQQKIGIFFLQLDESITLQQQKLDHLKERKKALLQQMFI